MRSISRTWLRFRPGERAEYSSPGIELAAYIVEKATGRPFTEHVQKGVFDPLGMTRSTYDLERVGKDGNRAAGHNRSFEKVPLENPMLAPGGANASLADAAAFLRFQLNDGKVGGRHLIDARMLGEMRTIPFPVKGQVAGYGLCLWIGAFHLGGQDVRWLAHGGGGFGYRCQMKWLPDVGYGVVVLTNSQDHGNVNDRLADDLLLKVVEPLTGRKELGPADWLARHLPSPPAGPAAPPPDLAGRYCGTNDDLLFLVKDGRFGYASGTAFVPLTAVSRDEHASKRYLYRFVRDGTGRPVSVVRPYDGTVWVLGSPSDEPEGPDRKDWARYTGSTVRKRFGLGERLYNVSVKNGWLHVQGDGQDFRLTEHVPGLFFTPDGEGSTCGARPSPTGTSGCTGPAAAPPRGGGPRGESRASYPGRVRIVSGVVAIPSLVFQGVSFFSSVCFRRSVR